MFRKKKCVAMLLAGGQGSRLSVLTKQIAKPAVHFGGKYRIIDFALSNCINSGIDTVGVLTQYQPLELNDYIENGEPWDLDRTYGGVHILPPYQGVEGGDWYKGTANAIYQNEMVGVQAIRDIVDKTDDVNLKNELNREANLFNSVAEDVKGYAKDNGFVVSENNFFEKSRLWMGINMSTLMDKSPRKIAELMLMGSVMGLITCYKDKYDHKGVDSRLDILKKIHLEHPLAVNFIMFLVAHY